MTLSEIRNHYNISQQNAANIIGIPVRTYRRYESDETYGDELKRNTFISLLKKHCEITESSGILTVDEIKEKLIKLFENEYKDKINICVLFGSYAKGTPREDSDVDLYVSTSLTGLKFVGLIERVRETLNKRIDLIRDSEIENNLALTREILAYGIRIYVANKW